MRYPSDLGQRFLVNKEGVELFLRGLRGAEGADVLEIGPGEGQLTMPVSRIARRLIGVELDGALAEKLSAKVPANVTVIVGDGKAYAEVTRTPVVVSNTPFYLSSTIIARAARNNNVKLMVLGLQLEVAKRAIARPGSELYGRLSVISQVYFRSSLLGVMPSSWFRPTPKVDAAVLRMERIMAWDSVGEALEAATRCLFSYRNKLARRALERCFGESSIKAVDGVGPGTRVRDLTPGQLLGVARWLTSGGSR
ncbi:MAG: 16S rRNA (adenine(1518)-N(6)/adenine(1519)-N(6))-dimethyltransferase RsmA [Acidilobus sp.]